MIKNYFKTAWRNLHNNLGYSAINILGLASGMAVALLIGLWVYNEFSYNKFLPDYDRIYQVRRNFNAQGEVLNFTSTSLRLADALREQIPEIEYVAESNGIGSHGFIVGEKKFYLPGIMINDNFLKMFGYPMLDGNAENALKDPYSIVLTESTAKSIFGAQNPINKTIRFDNNNNLKVTGILKDIPANSSLQFKYVVPFSYYEQTNPETRKSSHESFSNNGYEIYVKLKPGVTYSQVAPKIRDIEKVEKESINALKSDVIFQPMKNWHLYGEYVNGKALTGFIEYVRMFAIIGVLVLIIACINFVNLTTARSEKRAREVGVRKAIGSDRKSLIFQFLVESFLLTFIAFLFSILFVQLALPEFNNLTNNQIEVPYLNGEFWAAMVVWIFVTAVLAGSRPAFYLSSFEPVKVLKGIMKGGKSASLPRQILVVIQFTCSIALVISTITIYQQIQHAKDRPTGYNINRLMMTDINNDLARNYTALKNELLQKGIVESLTTSSSPATNIWWHSDVERWPGKNAGETIEMGTVMVTEDYFKTLNMTMLTGRDYDSPADTVNVIFNEAAIKEMRLKDPIGQTINWQGHDLRIIGVVKDALMVSPYSSAEPTMFRFNQDYFGNLIYRLSPQMKPDEAIVKLTEVFNKYNPAFPYDYKFADETYAAKFKQEVLVGKLAGIFATLAIFISCLGLFGLTAYLAEQRRKEIGIRKVLGASIAQVWAMLSKDFIWLVLISCIIASPLAYYFLDGWLHKYSYRIDIGMGVFVVAGCIAMLITLFTVSFQAIKAALANPVKSLRSE